ncbi:PEPxxWA-CTERM sorting domain-containing protein [Altericroceibacterium xinjiangense]|uniref:PEPxxWA-CTERM sorting domain-containing protein n=1 Tax=Altericroceibacterium xinjiangense TaxID=762261 RepID=UPI000F7DCC7F|nr:PEPxxWA-CTERM sorting domain-containing protein [Altericroceibacterium xinjiangense]
MNKFLYISCALSALFAVPAQAATIIESYNFSAITTGPITNHSGSFSFSYEDTDPFNLTLRSIDFSLNDFAFDTSNTGLELLRSGPLLAGLENGTRVVTHGTNDFWLVRQSGVWNFVYSVPGFGAAQGTAQVELASAIPEPTTWAMMLLGFGAIGFAMRKPGRRKVSASYA